MRLPAAPRVAALAFALAVTACDRPEPPPVVVRPPSLDSDDLAVMRGVLDGLHRPHFLVVDTTLTPCPAHPPRTGGRPTAECLSPGWLGFVSQLFPPNTSRMGLLAFDSRNRDRLAVSALGADVNFVSASAIDFLSSRELLGAYQPGSAIVTFSAPFHTAPGLAVIAYGLHQEPDVVAAARLERRGDGRWLVTSNSQYGGVY